MPSSCNKSATGVPVGLDEVAGLCGAAWWDTLAPHQQDGKWGAGYGRKAKQSMMELTSKLACPLRAALAEQSDNLASSETLSPPSLPSTESFDDAKCMNSGVQWATCAGLGWLAGQARLNAQAIQIPSPLSSLIPLLACCDEASLDCGIAALQPVIEARRKSIESRSDACQGEDVDAQQTDAVDEDEMETLLDLDAVFPPAAGLGLFLLESAANHSCQPSAYVAPAMVCCDESLECSTVAPGIALIAARDLEEGDEVTICYLGDIPDDSEEESGENRKSDMAAERRDMLKEQYLFTCKCPRCA